MTPEILEATSACDKLKACIDYIKRIYQQRYTEFISNALHLPNFLQTVIANARDTLPRFLALKLKIQSLLGESDQPPQHDPTTIKDNNKKRKQEDNATKYSDANPPDQPYPTPNIDDDMSLSKRHKTLSTTNPTLTAKGASDGGNTVLKKPDSPDQPLNNNAIETSTSTDDSSSSSSRSSSSSSSSSDSEDEVHGGNDVAMTDTPSVRHKKKKEVEEEGVKERSRMKTEGPHHRAPTTTAATTKPKANLSPLLKPSKPPPKASCTLKPFKLSKSPQAEGTDGDDEEKAERARKPRRRRGSVSYSGSDMGASSGNNDDNVSSYSKSDDDNKRKSRATNLFTKYSRQKAVDKQTKEILNKWAQTGPSKEKVKNAWEAAAMAWREKNMPPAPETKKAHHYSTAYDGRAHPKYDLNTPAGRQEFERQYISNNTTAGGNAGGGGRGWTSSAAMPLPSATLPNPPPKDAPESDWRSYYRSTAQQKALTAVAYGSRQPFAAVLKAFKVNVPSSHLAFSALGAGGAGAGAGAGIGAGAGAGAGAGIGAGAGAGIGAVKLLKDAYRMAVRMYHPDSNSKEKRWETGLEKIKCEEIMKIINEMRSTLQELDSY